MKKLLKNKWVILGLVLLAGIIIGRISGYGVSSNKGDQSQNEEVSAESQIWTCSMHPQIQQDGPGSCPLCGMDLIPLDNSMDGEEALPNEVAMSEAAMKLAEIQTYVVRLEKPEKEIRLLGKVKPDERLQYSQVIQFPGRIEKLHINFTGEKITKGQRLATIYSADLVTAQKELLEVLKDNSTSPALVEASRNKLKQWKITSSQIAAIESSGKIQTEIDILSDYSGYVMMRMVSEGDHVKEGQVLFEITDLRKVWILFEAYENDLPWIKVGDQLKIELKSVPGQVYEGKISFIDPFIDAKTRVAYVRVELNNNKALLKPDMFASGMVSSKLPIQEDVILAPKSSVLWTGKRGVVYVKLPDRTHNSFMYREVVLGEDAGEFYVIKEGLKEGEEIVTNGVFKVDASAQLAGKKSMMNPDGGKVNTGHDHGGMNMDGDEMAGMDMKPKPSIDKAKVSSKFKEQLGNVVAKYLELKNKLVSDNANSQTEVKAIQKSLQSVDMSLLKGDSHIYWMEALQSLNNDLDLISKSVALEEQRAIFLSISQSLSDVTQILGVQMSDDQSLYLEFCPMADDNNGGYWLSTEKQIKNPYFGQKMLKCGSVKSTIN